MYRDGANYKSHEQVIVAGEMTFNNIEDCLHEGENFIPSQVGLSNLQERMMGGVGEDDHVWHEIKEEDIEFTCSPATVEITADELVKNFRDSKRCWDISKAMDLIGLPV